ncbi:MAG: hypothetical protein ABSF25_17990 [Bryobacteraceae bacterium]|jgi:hypothetical protein
MANDASIHSGEETGKSSANASSSSDLSLVATPAAVWPGMTLNWGSPFREILLHAELPFWLLVADCSLRVTVMDCTLELSITGKAIEIQRGPEYQDSHSNTALIEKVEGEPSDRAAAILRGINQSGFTLRTTRTLISIKTNVLEDALAAIQESGRRRVDAQIYFRSFVHAHLSFVNKTINAYRRAGTDPFSVEVTEWDTPVWYIDADDIFTSISLIPYKDFDCLPVAITPAGEINAIAFVEASDIENALNLPEIPGEIDLLDAWSLYYRGRQSDAIRSLVTSLEVLLEVKLREYLGKAHLSETEVESRLNDSWNNFQARLTEYIQVSRRRVPGPILSILPYINGVRLREELEQVRTLRHKIVHEGERISYPFHGQMQRVMETMTWLFNWLAESPPPRRRRLEGDPLKTAMRGVLSLAYEYTPSGVVVQEHDPKCPRGASVEDELRRQLVAAIEKGSADIEKFALMAVSQVGFRGIDTPAPERTSPFLLERLILNNGSEFVPLFLHDTHETLGADVIERIAARLLALRVEGTLFSLALLIVNSQNGLEWQLREIAEAVSDAAAQTAVACGIAVVTTVDLLLLIKGVEERLWSFSEVLCSLMRSGRVGVEPPNFHYVGFVRKFFDRPRVASVVLDATATIRRGDFILIRLADRYHWQEVESMQKDGADIGEAHGCVIGIQTALRRSDVGVGDFVFVREGCGVSIKELIANMISEGCPNCD